MKGLLSLLIFSMVLPAHAGIVIYGTRIIYPAENKEVMVQLAGGGADLDVSVKEADGSVTTYLVPYAAVPNMLQPGVSKYDFAAGRSHIEGASKRARRNLFLINHKTILFNSYQRVTLSNPLHPWRKILFRVRQHLHITKQPHTSEANRIKNIA